MVMLPYRMSHTLIVGLLLVDLPVLLVIALVGWRHGYVNTYEGVSSWRVEHPWSFLPSALLAIIMIRRWRRSS